MSLQTKTYSIGDFAWQSWSNSYVLDLIITEESIDSIANTSLVSYKLQLRSGPNNYFETSGMYSWVFLDGNQENFGDIPCTPALTNHTYPLLEGTATILHNPSGSKTVNVRGKIKHPTGVDAAPPDMEINENFVLTPIPRGSKFISVSNFNIEDGFSFSVEKYSSSFVDELKISIGGVVIKTIPNYTNTQKINLTTEEILKGYKLLNSNNNERATITVTTKDDGRYIGEDSKTVTIYAKGTVRSGTNKRGVPWIKQGGKWTRGVINVKGNGYWHRGI